MCSGQTLWLLGVSGMIIEREAREDIPLLFMSLEPSLLRASPLHHRQKLFWYRFHLRERTLSLFFFVEVAVMSRFWLRGRSLI